jgi:hypothetical protein
VNEVSTLVSSRPDRSFTVTDQVARGLGWFSIGLGLAELIAPGKLAKTFGLEGREGLIRAYGAREIGAGMWALSDIPGPALWSRAAGDLLDLGTLALGARDGDEQQRRNAGIAIAAVVGVTLVDLLTAATITREQSQNRGETRDYSDRSGFPGGIAKAKGAAGDFTPADFKVTATEERASKEMESA